MNLPTAQEQIQLLKDEFAKYPNYKVNWIETYDRNKPYGVTREVKSEYLNAVITEVISAIVQNIMKQKKNSVDIFLLNELFPQSYLGYFIKEETTYLTCMVGTRL